MPDGIKDRGRRWIEAETGGSWSRETGGQRGWPHLMPTQVPEADRTVDEGGRGWGARGRPAWCIHRCRNSRQGGGWDEEWGDDEQQRASGPRLVRPGEQWNHSGVTRRALCPQWAPLRFSQRVAPRSCRWRKGKDNCRLLISQRFCESKINQQKKTLNFVKLKRKKCQINFGKKNKIHNIHTVIWDWSRNYTQRNKRKK